MNPIQLSVVVPVFNEAENIEPLITEIYASLEPADLNFEVIYVNDGSTDESEEILRSLMEKFKSLRLINHAKSCGQSTAVHTGVSAARGEVIATLDGDGQNDPADIPNLLEEAGKLDQNDLWLIAGWRTKRKDTWLKRFSSRLANSVRSRMLRDQTPDTGCGLKLFPRELFLKLPYFDHMHRFLPALTFRAGGIVKSVPVRHRPRERGTSKYGLHNRLWVGIVDLFGVMWLLRRARVAQVSEHTQNQST